MSFNFGWLVQTPSTHHVVPKQIIRLAMYQQNTARVETYDCRCFTGVLEYWSTRIKIESRRTLHNLPTIIKVWHVYAGGLTIWSQCHFKVGANGSALHLGEQVSGGTSGFLLEYFWFHTLCGCGCTLQIILRLYVFVHVLRWLFHHRSRFADYLGR